MSEDSREREARLRRRQWGERLDRFVLPCPLCRGELHFHGVGEERFYEFTDGEPGTVTPLDVQPITFICERCGYTAAFDAELFNPAHLAQLQGAPPERIAALSIRDYQVLVPLTGAERSETLLDLATGVAGVHHGEVLVLHVAPEEAPDAAVGEQLVHRLEAYVPAPGHPAPVRLVRRQGRDVGDAIVAMAADKRVELVLVGWRGWTHQHQAILGSVLDTVLREALADVGFVHDRGLTNVRRILLPTAGGPHARLAARLALDLARAFDAELHLLYVASPKIPDAEEAGAARIGETLNDAVAGEDAEHEIDVARRVVVSGDPARAIVEEAAGYDLLLIGASPRGWLGRLRRGDIALKIARNCNPTSIVVSARATLLGSWLSRLVT